MTSGINGISVSGEIIQAECGISVSTIVRSALINSLSGFEELSGIPGRVGGMVTSNAGAFGKSISDILIKAEVYDKDRDCITILNKNELLFSYRDSLIKRMNERYTLLSAEFHLFKSDSVVISRRIADYAHLRRERQPVEPSLGSTFKRPKRGFASEMIDRAGLKGLSQGGAQISEKHAGFIINRGGATAKEYIGLADVIKAKIFDLYGISLEYEVEYLESKDHYSKGVM